MGALRVIGLFPGLLLPRFRALLPVFVCLYPYLAWVPTRASSVILVHQWLTQTPSGFLSMLVGPIPGFRFLPITQGNPSPGITGNLVSSRRRRRRVYVVSLLTSSTRAAAHSMAVPQLADGSLPQFGVIFGWVTPTATTTLGVYAPVMGSQGSSLLDAGFFFPSVRPVWPETREGQPSRLAESGLTSGFGVGGTSPKPLHRLGVSVQTGGRYTRLLALGDESFLAGDSASQPPFTRASGVIRRRQSEVSTWGSQDPDTLGSESYVAKVLGAGRLSQRSTFSQRGSTLGYASAASLRLFARTHSFDTLPTQRASSSFYVGQHPWVRPGLTPRSLRGLASSVLPGWRVSATLGRIRGGVRGVRSRLLFLGAYPMGGYGSVSRGLLPQPTHRHRLPVLCAHTLTTTPSLVAESDAEQHSSSTSVLSPLAWDLSRGDSSRRSQGFTSVSAFRVWAQSRLQWAVQLRTPRVRLENGVSSQRKLAGLGHYLGQYRGLRGLRSWLRPLTPFRSNGGGLHPFLRTSVNTSSYMRAQRLPTLRSRVLLDLGGNARGFSLTSRATSVSSQERLSRRYATTVLRDPAGLWRDSLVSKVRYRPGFNTYWRYHRRQYVTEFGLRVHRQWRLSHLVAHLARAHGFSYFRHLCLSVGCVVTGSNLACWGSTPVTNLSVLMGAWSLNGRVCVNPFFQVYLGDVLSLTGLTLWSQVTHTAGVVPGLLHSLRGFGGQGYTPVVPLRGYFNCTDTPSYLEVDELTLSVTLVVEPSLGDLVLGVGQGAGSFLTKRLYNWKYTT